MRRPDRAPDDLDTTGTDARFESLVRDYARLVRHAIRSAGGLEGRPLAEDIEQQVFLALWQQVRREQTIDHPTSYIYQAAVRETVRAIRRARARPEVRLTEVAALARRGAGTELLPDAEAVAAEQRQALADAIAALAADRGRAVRAHLQGLTVREIMALFSWDYQKARNLVARGMADLRAALKKSGTR
jgi:RNA polymerase sigma factor (sigma-70 family)